MYAVVGATGNTGRAVVKELKGLGENPVCIVRNADKAKEVLGADTKTAMAELDDRAGLQKALAGAKRVFVVTGHNPKSAEQQINVIEAAKAAGAEFIVKVSGGRDVIGPNVESVNGQVIALATGRPLAPGATINEGDAVRTTTGSRAVLRLRDGSALEMNERSELAVRAAWSGQRIRLERGDVIVQAAKQRRGRLQLRVVLLC